MDTGWWTDRHSIWMIERIEMENKDGMRKRMSKMIDEGLYIALSMRKYFPLFPDWQAYHLSCRVQFPIVKRVSWSRLDGFVQWLPCQSDRHTWNYNPRPSSSPLSVRIQWVYKTRHYCTQSGFQVFEHCRAQSLDLLKYNFIDFNPWKTKWVWMQHASARVSIGFSHKVGICWNTILFIIALEKQNESVMRHVSASVTSSILLFIIFFT